MSTIESVDDGFAWVESFLGVDRGSYRPRRHRLPRMRALFNAFGDPQLAYRTVHVTGSKGKGSVSVLIASALDAAGLRCGLYTSPHVESYRERVRVLDGSLTDGLAVSVFEELRVGIESLTAGLPVAEFPTTFELLTLYGFIAFRAARCDIAVVEVGIGGRTDATNLLRPTATVITRVELEHTDLLGTTLRAIAAEKSGVIRRGVPVFVTAQSAETMATIERVAKIRSAPVRSTDDLVIVDAVRTGTDGTRVRLRLAGVDAIETTLRLVGDVQANNAALAALTLTETIAEITPATIAVGFSRAFLPGRSELVPGSPAILLDGAHTGESVRLLCRTAAAICPDRHGRIALFGAVAGKNHAAMLRELVGAFSCVVIARPGTFKESDTAALYRLCRSLGGNCIREDDVADALAAARGAIEVRTRSGAAGLIVVTGSFYLVGEARTHLRDEGLLRGVEHA